MGLANKVAAFLDKIAEWAIYILIFTIPFSKSIIEIVIVVSLVSLVLKKIVLKEGFSADYKYINIFLVIYLAFSALSLYNTQYMNLSLRALFSKSFKFAALFFIIKEIINTRTKLNNFITMAFLSCIIILGDGFIQYFITHKDFLLNYPAFYYVPAAPNGITFPTASFPFPNDFAAWIIVFVFPVAAFAFWAKAGWQRSALAALALAGLLYSLILTKVRGALIGFLIAFGILSCIKLKRVGVVLMILFILSPFVINKALVPHIFSMGSMNDRSVMWQNGMKIFEKHPIIGNGLNTFFVEYREIRNDSDRGKRGSYAHNCYLQMAAEIGLLGLAFFLLFVTAVLAAGFRALKTTKDPLYYSLIMGILLGLIAFLIHSAGDTNLYSLPLAALFWLSAGILLATVKLAGSNV